MPPSFQPAVPPRRFVFAHAAVFLCLAGLFGLLAVGPGRQAAPAATGVLESPILFRAELRSWIVAGRGRHMYLQIEAPAEFPELRPRIEFTSAFLRADYEPAADQAGRPRVGRMTPGRALGPPPFAPIPDNRLEATYTLTLAQARALQRDRLFAEPYVLLGANSSSGLRRALEEVGLALPDRVLRGGGFLGEFPGIDIAPGAEIGVEEWPRFGLIAATPR